MSESNGKPAWAEQLTAKYKSGVTHTFSLHFNVDDYADHTNCPLKHSFAANARLCFQFDAAKLCFQPFMPVVQPQISHVNLLQKADQNKVVQSRGICWPG